MANGGGGGGGGGTGSPCGACKFLRRKCAADCIFAPYFCSEQGPARFAAIHKVFGASNVSKLLLHVPVHHRCEAVVTIAYEAQARTNDPVYGCVAHIYALQQQVAVLQAQLMQVKAQLAQNILIDPSTSNHRFSEQNHYWTNTTTMCTSATTSPSYNPTNPTFNNDLNCISPQSSICSIESFDPNSHGICTPEMRSGSDDIWFQTNVKKRSAASETNELAELQALAFRMMKN